MLQKLDDLFSLLFIHEADDLLRFLVRQVAQDVGRLVGVHGLEDVGRFLAVMREVRTTADLDAALARLSEPTKP